MDDITEIPEDKLPTRKCRGKKKDYDAENKKERDPMVTGWNKLKQGKWSMKRSERLDGLHYVIKKCMQEGTKEDDLYQIIADTKNELAIEAEDS